MTIEWFLFTLDPGPERDILCRSFILHRPFQQYGALIAGTNREIMETSLNWWFKFLRQIIFNKDKVSQLENTGKYSIQSCALKSAYWTYYMLCIIYVMSYIKSSQKDKITFCKITLAQTLKHYAYREYYVQQNTRTCANSHTKDSVLLHNLSFSWVNHLQYVGRPPWLRSRDLKYEPGSRG